jgi:hypothetical protein
MRPLHESSYDELSLFSTERGYRNRNMTITSIDSSNVAGVLGDSGERELHRQEEQGQTIEGNSSTAAHQDNSTAPISTRRTESQKRRVEFKMLTSSQLADLFRRLDSDNNGELDVAEFLAMAMKLNLPKYLGLREESHDAEEYMKSIFREIDIAETGTLDMEQFQSAYLMVCTCILSLTHVPLFCLIEYCIRYKHFNLHYY